jgi:hypothetical protein
MKVVDVVDVKEIEPTPAADEATDAPTILPTPETDDE